MSTIPLDTGTRHSTKKKEERESERASYWAGEPEQAISNAVRSRYSTATHDTTQHPKSHALPCLVLPVDVLALLGGGATTGRMTATKRKERKESGSGGSGGGTFLLEELEIM